MLGLDRKVRDRIGARKQIAVDVRKLFQLRAEIWIATVDGSIEHVEKLNESRSTIGRRTQIIIELIALENKRIVGVETKDQPHA